MGKENLPILPEKDLKRLMLVFPEGMMPALSVHADTQGATVTSLLRAYLKLRRFIETQQVACLNAFEDPIIRVGDEIVDFTNLMDRYGSLDISAGRMPFNLPINEYSQVTDAAMRSDETVSSYIRKAAAIGIQIEDTAWEHSNTWTQGCPLSVGPHDFTFIY